VCVCVVVCVCVCVCMCACVCMCVRVRGSVGCHTHCERVFVMKRSELAAQERV